MGEEGGEDTVTAIIAVTIVAVVAVAIAALVAVVVVGRYRAAVEVVATLGRHGALGRCGQKRGVPLLPNCASLLLSPSRQHHFCCHGGPPRHRGRPVPCRHGSRPRFGVPCVDKRSHRPCF